MNENNGYSRTNPFMGSIKERYSLCKSGSQKNTHHIVIDLKGSGLHYDIGDCIGIYPQHDSELVLRTIKALKAKGSELITDKRTGETLSLQDFLQKKANITDFSRKFVQEIAEKQTNNQKKERLNWLLHIEQRDEFKKFQEMREIWDILEEHPEVNFSPQEFANLAMPLLPRLYSIASSKNVVGDEVHLTVAIQNYEVNYVPRFGVCTHYLCHMASLNKPEIPLYIHPNTGFTLPEDSSKSIIMIGPGTGVAPFRAFMQERIAHGASGKNWLFFGEWHERLTFFYEDFWKELVQQGKLKLDNAFSRDQEQKIYVQHRMLENAKEFFRWLEEGAYLYVCGDAHRMAKDVEATLIHIVQEQGKMDIEAAKQYVKHLRTTKRYLRDVY